MSAPAGNVVALKRPQRRPQSRCVPLTMAHVDAFEFRSDREERLVREHLGLLLLEPEWAYALLVDERVAMIGGLLWASPCWCHAALAPAAWMRPMMWRRVLPICRQIIDRAHRAGATRIEAIVRADSIVSHRLMLALGFDFCGLQTGRDGTATAWLVYDIAPRPPLDMGMAMAECWLKVMSYLENG